MIKHTLFLLLMSIVGYSQPTKQPTNAIHIKPFIGYGILSITQLQNPDLYAYVYTKGDFFGGISCDYHTNFRYSLYVGYEKSNPVLNGAKLNKDVFIQTTYIGAGLQYFYYSQNKCKLYSGLSSLLIKTNKQLPLENGTFFKNALDITIIGIDYSISKRAAVAIQIGAGESGFIKGLIYF